MQNFDYKGSAEYAMNYMQGVIKGIDNMMNMSADMIRTGELEKEEEKVILVFFGDHQPNIGALEVDTEESNAYKVPYFIWANYDTGVEPKREQNTSANFLQSKLMEIAGLPKTGYMQYLLELQESLPVICAKFYQDATGTMYRADDKTSEYQAKKEEYHKLVYYKMFEK